MASSAALMRVVPVVLHLAQPPKPYIAGNCARSTSVPPNSRKAAYLAQNRRASACISLLVENFCHRHNCIKLTRVQELDKPQLRMMKCKPQAHGPKRASLMYSHQAPPSQAPPLMGCDRSCSSPRYSCLCQALAFQVHQARLYVF